jgi:teichuronic acid biosynthesis glycosyltransferase TuaH
MGAGRNGHRPAERGLVIVIAGTSWDGIWQSERHVAMHLAKDQPVLWVDPQISHLSFMRNPDAARMLGRDRLRQVAPNITRLTPVTVPGVTRPGLRRVGTHQARRAVRRAVRLIGTPVQSTLVASLNDMLDVVPEAQRVFYGTDDYVASAPLTGMSARWLRQRTRHQLLAADLVLATSPVLQHKWSDYRQDISMIPNGCESEHFAAADSAPPPRDVHLSGPIAGFVGHLSERMDLRMLDAVASSGVSVLLVGPRQLTFEMAKLDRLLAMPNVQWVGPKEFEELPSYLRVIDVGLTPYAQSDFNRASFPLKTLEYLAAGRPVVGSDLPAHRWLDTPHVSVARTPREFAERTRSLLDAGRSERDASARRALGARHSWAARTGEIRRLLHAQKS